LLSSSLQALLPVAVIDQKLSISLTAASFIFLGSHAYLPSGPIDLHMSSLLVYALT